MTEKRKYPRFACKIRADFDFYSGDPDKIDRATSVPEKGTGVILDLSLGGMFLASNNRVGINCPVTVSFSTKKGDLKVNGRVNRTGQLQNNPSEVARAFAKFADSGDYYIAVEFDTLLDNISGDDL